MKTINFKDFNSMEAAQANRLVDYYEGEQLRYLKAILDGKGPGNYGGRHDWKTRGFIPRVRNITKAIVDKSAPLFNKPPTLEIWRQGTSTPVVDETLQDILYKADWLEFFNNVDHYTRLLKTTVVLQQKYIPVESTTTNGIYRFNKGTDALMLLLLHQGNCVVKLDPTESHIIEIAYLTSKYDHSDGWTYRVITPEEVIDVAVKDDKETEYANEPNLDGIVPATMFYDVNKPRCGAWHNIPEDLISLQEMINLHLTDTEFAVAWQKQKTLFHTASFVDNDSNNNVQVPYAAPGHIEGAAVYEDLPAFEQNVKNNIGGLGSSVQLTLDPQGNAPLIKFDGPETDLLSLNNLMSDVCENVASDWSVQLNIVARSATSGFQLLVEELPNLALREKRAQVFGSSLRRLYETMRVLYPELSEGDLLIVFSAPSIPVDQKEQEELWDKKIAGGRASVLDYFMEVKGLTKEEALSKIEEIKLMKELNSPPPPVIVAQPIEPVEPIEPIEPEDG